jgi:hypothetical protein
VGIIGFFIGLFEQICCCDVTIVARGFGYMVETRPIQKRF